MDKLPYKFNFCPGSRPVQSFETQYLNTNYFTFRSLFGLGDIKVFGLIFDLIEI
jgi:hypothetical protein